METMAKVQAYMTSLENSGDLRSYAAMAALAELAGSWRDALQDGVKHSELVADLDLVIAALENCKPILA